MYAWSVHFGVYREEWLVYFVNDVQFGVHAHPELMIYSRLLLYSSKYLFIFCIVDTQF